LNTAPDGQVFVDVGANLGYFTLAAASLGYKVIAFEPMSRNAQKLAKSIQRNEQFASRVTLYQNAVTALSGQPVTLHETHHSNQGNGQIVVSDADIMDGILDHDDNVLHSVTLSEVLQGVNTFIVKIDVEGHENEVLEGAREWICKNVVKHIIMEISDATKLSSHPSLSTLIDFLTAAGYEMADVAVGSTVLQTHTVDALPPNVIFSLKGNTPTCLTYGSDQDTL
jgi:FkbM family methyltransferase